MADFKGKLAIVTGSAKQNGIGFATAHLLAQLGADILLHYNTNHDAAQTSAELMRTFGVTVVTVHSNAAEPSFGTDLITACKKSFPNQSIDIIVNNAADARFSDGIAASTLEDFSDMFNANVRGPLLLIQAALPHLTSPGGRIINVGTVVARLGTRHANIYAGTKAALNAMTRGWAEELGERGVTVNVVAPGPIDTDYVPAEEHQLVQKFRAAQHLVRNGTAKEVAEVIKFVASPGSSFLTGQVIGVDGGLSYC
ncbi:putative oxido YhxC [Cyphellophora attinorum]|uniref:Putative oxido YhxC n=1 Tax=Cyphellophora attinorum TaxID=1664694 RepID=A0A0N1HY05_9EURO|nr:putative oxido YhxC [Phialophora attinorum]KPI43074.1 putative oxido YhxC [Phialophora attinorum]